MHIIGFKVVEQVQLSLIPKVMVLHIIHDKIIG